MGDSPKDFRDAKASRAAAATMGAHHKKHAKQPVNRAEMQRSMAPAKFKSPSTMRSSMKKSFGNRDLDAKHQKWRFKEPNRNGQLVKKQKHGFNRSNG